MVLVVAGLFVRMMILCLLLVGGAMAAGAFIPGVGQIAYTSAQEGDLDIVLMDISRQMTFNLTHNPENDWKPVWSPDGTQLAFVSDRDNNREIYIMDVGCRGLFIPCDPHVRRLTNNPASDVDPAWSPDGSQIAFMSERYGYTEIFVVPASGGAPRRLTRNSYLDANPAWSPDGRWIAFASDREQRWDTDLYRMDADGSNVQRLLHDPNNEFYPAWSPDGSHLVYSTYGAVSGQLGILDVASGQTTLLLDNKGNDDTPAWSPDGQLLALVSFRDGNPELYLLRLDCVGAPAACLRRLTFTPALELSPQWRPKGSRK